MKKRLLVLSVFLVFLVALTGCNSNSDFDYDPYFGSEGLEMSFVDNAPPDEVLEKQQVPLGIFLKNNGAYDIDDGVISVAVEEDYMTLPTGDDFTILLAGRSVYDENGEETTKMFYSDVKSLDKMSEYHENVNVLVSACYRYRNMMKTSVCIDPDVYNLNEGEKPCMVEDISSSGQGGPVGVTSVKETITTDKEDIDVIYPTFDLIISNLGSGKVVDYFYVKEFCGPMSMPDNSFNLVYATAYIGETPLSCQPNPIRLGDDRNGRTICRPVEGFQKTATSYTTLLSVYLEYGYTFSISKSTAIEKVRT